MALIHITDGTDRHWQYHLSSETVCTIGRAPDSAIVLNDPKASRQHARIEYRNGLFLLVDGTILDGQVKRSVNQVFVNDAPRLEHELKDGDLITIGGCTLRFEQGPLLETDAVDYNDDPLGRTQLLVSPSDVVQAALQPQPDESSPREETAALRRKAEVLTLLYEMSNTLGSILTLDAVFEKATDILLRVTPADRVLALLADPESIGTPSDAAGLKVVAMKVRDPKAEDRAKHVTIGRTITRKAMRERAALLSQDASADPEFAQVDSIVAQGIRSTICAPLITDSRVHGALYADRLDTFASFTRDDLQLVTAIAAQTAMAVETVRSHERLAREEVARANYARFMPAYVVQQILQNPDSFKLGGVNQTVTVLFADIRGFTRLSERASPEKVVQLLNRYFTGMSEVIFKYGGTLDKYIGDGLMALFGAPTMTPDDARNAVTAAVEMQREVVNVNRDLRALGFAEIGVGIGLHTGEATVGYIGSDRRSEYTAIGDTVNLSQRLEANAKPEQILISEETRKAATRLPYALQPREPIKVKNREQPVTIFEIDWRSGG